MSIYFVSTSFCELDPAVERDITVVERIIANTINEEAWRPRRSTSAPDPADRLARFATDSPLEGNGFEPVWGFSCQAIVSGCCRFFVRRGKPFFVPSPAIGFAERAEGVKGPKR